MLQSIIKYCTRPTEIVVLICVLFAFNNYIGNPIDTKTIGADGVGYYDYLPSIFIRHDLNRKDFTVEQNPTLYQNLPTAELAYNDHKGFKVNQYTFGTALLQSPFFLYTLLTTDTKNPTGYEQEFHNTIFVATLFYLILGLYFIRKLLETYAINKITIFWIQAITALGTPILLYTGFDAAYSHVYSFAIIAAFALSARRYLTTKKTKYIILTIGLLGLIFILRQINILVILFIPFLMETVSNLKEVFKDLFREYKSTIIGITVCCIFLFTQMLVWNYQTGDWILNSYERPAHLENYFDFLHPNFYNFLFSYQKGLFVYTPVLIFSIIGIIWLGFSKRIYEASTWITAFLLISYVMSSWNPWHYGCSLGQRPFIDFFPVLFIPIALLIQNSRWIKWPILIIATLAIPLSVSQVYQYKEYILHWWNMDKEKYWTIFLKTDDEYKGLVWKDRLDESSYETIYEIDNQKRFEFTKENSNELFKLSLDSINNDLPINGLILEFEGRISENSKNRILTIVEDTVNNTSILYDDRSTLHFSEGSFGQNQTGRYYYRLSQSIENSTSVVSVYFICNDSKCHITSPSLKLISIH